MRLTTRTLLLAAAMTAVCHAQTPSQASAPLPDATQLIHKAQATEKATFAARENYLCKLHNDLDELDSHGNVKKHSTEDVEEFFANGHPIDHTLAKDGKPLYGEDAAKEQDRVDQEVKKYSEQKQLQKEESEDEKRVDSVLRMEQFLNESRSAVNGRSTIHFDLSGNMAAQPQDVSDRFVQAMLGTIELDEATGQLVDLQIHSVKDVKIAGGLVANLHKGFVFHLHQTLHPDGVWLPNLVEGQGDARAALFVHKDFRFRRTAGACHLYGATATQTGSTVVVPPAAR